MEQIEETSELTKIKKLKEEVERLKRENDRLRRELYLEVGRSITKTSDEVASGSKIHDLGNLKYL